MKVNLNKARAEALSEAADDTGWTPGQIVAKLVDDYLEDAATEIGLGSLAPGAD